MKKGRRQIVEKNVFENEEQQIPNQIETIQTFHPENLITQNGLKIQKQQQPAKNHMINSKNEQLTNKSSYSLENRQNIINNKNNHVNHVDEQSSISAYSVVNKKQNTEIYVRKQKQVVEEQNLSEKNANDQKKSRIQMLKQKYLKKGTEPKPSQVPDVIVQSSKISTQKYERQRQKIVNTKETYQSKRQAKQETQPNNIKDRQQLISITKKDRQENLIEVYQSNNDIKQTNKISTTKNIPEPGQIYQQCNNKKNQNIHLNGSQHQIQQKKQLKTQQKKQFKVPPPPPQKNKIRPNYVIDTPYIPTQQINSNITNVKASSQETVQVINQQSVIQPEEQKSTKVELSHYPENLKAKQNNSVKSRVPPPPPSKKTNEKPNAVQQLLQRKLRKQVQTQPQSMFSDKKEENQVIQQQIPFINPIQLSHQSKATKNDDRSPVAFDEEFIDTAQTVPTQSKQEYSAPSNQFSFSQIIQLWCNTSEQLFPHLFGSSSRICSMVKPSKKQIVLHSTNPEFTPLMNRIVMQLVLKNTSALSDDQEKLIHQIGLQYFFSKSNVLSTQFLLILVRLSNNYLIRYKEFFRTSIQQYCLDLLQYRSYFNDIDTVSFVDFILTHWQPKQQHYYLLILLYPTDKLLTHLYNHQIKDKRSILFALAATQQIFKTNKNILGLYIRLISSVCDLIQQNFILQAILKYINQIEPHQKYYQAQKQLKLKLIGLISARGQQKTNQRKNDGVQSREFKQQKKQDKAVGLMGIWSKAVDKIKTATSQLTEKQKQKPEEPVDQIKYDPVTKRYMVNGKFLEDQDNKQQQHSPIKAPPPPPKGNKPVAPPPPGNKKPRTVTATNRYA